VAEFFDDFNRPDGDALGNGWTEKTPIAFRLAGGEVVKQSTITGYRDNLIYRPEAEDLLDVEASIEFRYPAFPISYPQVLVRAQRPTLAAPDAYDGYVLYVEGEDGEVDTDIAVIGRQLGVDFETTLATIVISPPLDIAGTYRLRLRAVGTDPVALSAWIERFDGSSWQEIASASVNDVAAERITAPGAIGFAADDQPSPIYDNFGWRAALP
jgi:hypothetical protein